MPKKVSVLKYIPRLSKGYKTWLKIISEGYRMGALSSLMNFPDLALLSDFRSLFQISFLSFTCCN
jgi:hypothetical protein